MAKLPENVVMQSMATLAVTLCMWIPVAVYATKHPPRPVPATGIRIPAPDFLFG